MYPTSARHVADQGEHDRRRWKRHRRPPHKSRPPCGMQEGIFGGAAGQRHRTYRFTNGGRRACVQASTAEREGGPVVHQDLLVFLAAAAKKSISFAEHNTLVRDAR
jgi:hypothetical protein